MATYYADLSLIGTGGDGSIGNPWYTQSFKNRCNGLLPGGSIVKVKGEYDYTADPTTFTILGITIENWTSDPWRIRAPNYLLISYSIIKNGIIDAGNSLIQFFDGSSKAIDCQLVSTLQLQLLSGGIEITGCSIKVPEILSSINITHYGLFKDSVIDCPAFQNCSGCIWDNCAFSALTVSGTSNDCQYNWSMPSLPAWNAAQSSFSSSILGVGLHTPPLPGNPPYTGYNKGLFDSTRTGIGAFYFDETIYYADLNALVSGDGSLLTPWNAAQFKTNAVGTLPSGSVIKVKGSHDYGTGFDSYISINGIGSGGTAQIPITVENWTSDPVRIKCGLFYPGWGATVKNFIVYSDGYISCVEGAVIIDCQLKSDNYLTLGSNSDSPNVNRIIGSTLISVSIRGGLGSFQPALNVLTDSILQGPLTCFDTTNSSNCCFTASSIPVGGVHTQAQLNWTPPAWPAWNDAKSAFSIDPLASNITTPPEPGDPPYTGYEQGLWNTTRTGIGALNFETDPGVYYANIDLIGTGGDGTFSNPWWSNNFVTQVGSLTSSDTIKVKGIFDHPGIAGISVSCNLKNWTDAPFRISSENISIAGNINVKNCILRGRVGLSITSDAKCLSCYIEANIFTIGFGTSQGTAMGCTIFAPNFNGGAGSIAYLKDCVISSTVFGSMAGTVTSRCVFMSGVPVGSHTDYQEHWPSPSWPVWNGARELFNSKRFSPNIHYPPQPGTLDYYTYEYGLWNSVRTGVGALDFVDEWSDITPGSMSFNAVAVGGTKVMAVGYNGSIEMLSF